jgi:hypothetical protein
LVWNGPGMGLFLDFGGSLVIRVIGDLLPWALVDIALLFGSASEDESLPTAADGRK